jgi:hypothetical protein
VFWAHNLVKYDENPIAVIPFDGSTTWRSKPFSAVQPEQIGSLKFIKCVSAALA